MAEGKKIWQLLRDLKERYIALSNEERKSEVGVAMLQRLKELSEELEKQESNIAIFFINRNKYTIPLWQRQRKP